MRSSDSGVAICPLIPYAATPAGAYCAANLHGAWQQAMVFVKGTESTLFYKARRFRVLH